MNARFEANLARLEDTALAVRLRMIGAREEYRSSPLGKLPEARELLVQGTAFDASCSWLEADPLRRAYFIESDLEKLCALLSSEEGTRLLMHPQASLHTRMPETGLDVAVVGDVNSLFLELAGRLRWQREDRALFRRNLRANLLDLPKSYLATDLWGRFAGIPAIICGAGPSLDAAIPAVNRMRNQALVLAGGSALRAEALRPHLGGVIDPVTPPINRVPLFFRHRTHPGARGYYVSGASGYREVDALDAMLELPESGVDEGVSVTCFLLSIAKQMGCTPLILVGVDLGLVNGQEYAEAVGQPGWNKPAQWALEQAWIAQREDVIWGLPKMLWGSERTFDLSASACPSTQEAEKMLDYIEKLEQVLARESGTGQAIIAEVELECLLTR